MVAYTPASPFIIEEDNRLEGISVWLWEQCAEELGLEYQLKPMPFRDVLDSLATGGIDVSINPLTITSKRMNEMQFTMPFYASYSVVVKQHFSTFQRIKQFFKSLFSINFLSGFLVLMTLIVVFGLLIWYYERKENPEIFRDGYQGVWDGLWWSVVTMTTVGYGDKTPKSRGGKIVALIWMFSGLLFISGLTASVASSLTVNRLSSDLGALEEFKYLSVGTIQHSSSEQYLKDNFFKKIQLFPNVTAGLEAVRKHQLDAFVYDEPIVRYRLLNDKAYKNLVVLPHKYQVQFYAFALPKGKDSLQQALSYEMTKIMETHEWQIVLNEYGCGDK